MPSLLIERDVALHMAFAEWALRSMPPKTRRELRGYARDLQLTLIDLFHGRVLGYAQAWVKMRVFADPAASGDFMDSFTTDIIDGIHFPSIWTAASDAAKLGYGTAKGVAAISPGAADVSHIVEQQQAFGSQLIKGILHNAGPEINNVISSGIKSGASREMIMDSLLSKIQTSVMPEWRARLIAQTECLPGDSVVDGAEAVAIYRRWYEGNVIEIRTRGGHKFTGTPNHPVLTQTGWKGLGEITEGDCVVCYGKSIQADGMRDPNIENHPATLAEIFDSAAGVLGFEAQREICLDEDFHGDGRQGYVDVLRPNRVLKLGHFVPLDERSCNLLLAPTNLTHALAAAQSSPFIRDIPVDQRIALRSNSQGQAGRLYDAFDYTPANAIASRERASRFARSIGGYDGGIGQIGSRARVPRGGEAIRRSGALATDGRATFRQNAADDAFVASQHLTDPTSRGASQVTLNDVVSVKIVSFAGHVYNLTTLSGYYIANGLYTGNTIRSYNAGSVERYKQAGVTHITWLDGQPGACSECSELDGATIAIEGGAFESTGRVFSVDYPPLHPGCRCTCVSSTDAEIAAMPEEAPTAGWDEQAAEPGWDAKPVIPEMAVLKPPIDPLMAELVAKAEAYVTERLTSNWAGSRYYVDTGKLSVSDINDLARRVTGGAASASSEFKVAKQSIQGLLKRPDFHEYVTQAKTESAAETAKAQAAETAKAQAAKDEATARKVALVDKLLEGTDAAGMHEYLLAEYGKDWASGLTSAQRVTLLKYIGQPEFGVHYFQEINSALRAGKEFPGTKALDGALASHPLARDVTVFRTIDKEFGDTILNQPSFVDLGYTSTTTNPEFVAEYGGWTLRIHVPAGTPSAYTSHLQFDPEYIAEQEFIIARGRTYRVDNIDRSLGLADLSVMP